MGPFKQATIFMLGNRFPITNDLLDTLLVDLILVAGSYLLVNNLKEIPGLLQNGLETVVDSFYDLTKSVAPSQAASIFPYFMTFFLFILIANWSGLIPGINTVGFFRNGRFIPFLRSATSNLNTTVALALISAFATHILSIKNIGIKQYLSRYFSLNPLNLFIGMLEIISEITKVISLSFRLFGNIFAGEILLATVSGMLAVLLPLPFLLLEILVGLVQALVFSMLTMVFMAILSTPPHNEANQISANQQAKRG